jgi:two-component system, OmpR family, manganese sensing sensor histidine kinase
MFQSTRRRLAIWYTTVTAILLLLFASGFYGYVRLTLIERIDDTIAHVVEVLERSLIKDRDMNLKSESRFADNLEADHIDIEWFSPKGDLVWSTMPLSTSIPLVTPNLSPHPQPKYRTVYLTSEPVRQLTEPVELNHELLGYLRVSHPWFEVTKPIKQLLLDLAIGTSIMVAVVAMCGWWLSGIAMEPVRASYQRLKQFTADASHELRNPIAVIQTNVQVALADPVPNWQNQQHQLEVIERITRRLGRLLDDLLFLARQDARPDQKTLAVVKSPCDLCEILEDVIEEQSLIAQAKGIEMAVQNLTSTTILGDRSQLIRLFTNLVSNAITYTAAGGKVTVAQILHSHQVQIQIKDSGIGIPETALTDIFERFWRYQPQSQQGSGLGLAIALAITENHQGQIKVESTLGVGSTFTVILRA